MSEFSSIPKKALDKLPYNFLLLDPEHLNKSARKPRTANDLSYNFSRMPRAIDTALASLTRFNKEPTWTTPGGVLAWMMLEDCITNLSSRFDNPTNPPVQLENLMRDAKRDLVNSWRGVEKDINSPLPVEQANTILIKADLDMAFIEALQNIEGYDDEANESGAKCGAAVVALTVGALLVNQTDNLS